ncbi:MAG TPA: hypothetical protein VLI92_02205, partial [Candidatus Saccharimonadales bacterium]|nr:hypothetical protein [Candidatus Saccharimonadales bacterium]
PSGVFDAVSKGGDKSFTWQPMKGVRSAVVVSKYTANGQTGFVLAGRSLVLVEERIMKLGLMVLVAWFVTLVLTFASFVVSDKLKKKFMS